MANLIIALLAIALIAVIALSTLYSGGDSFLQGSAKSYASQLVNAGQQISAANLLYANENRGTYTDSIADLTANGEYLASIPRVPEGFSEPTVDGDNVITIASADAADEICEAVNKNAGYGDEVILADAAAVTNGFGCHGVAGTSATFIFK